MGRATLGIPALCALFCLPLQGTGALAAEPVWLDLATPAEGATLRAPQPWIEVRGRAVRGSDRPYDLVVAVDLSASTLYPAGFDVDGDGLVGEPRYRRVRTLNGSYRPHRRWTTDSGDTIVRAELRATHALLRRLERHRVRAGLLTFAGRGKLRAPVDTPERALEALERVRVTLNLTGTNLAAATRLGAKALLRAGPQGPAGRDKILAILSDGYPTVPDPQSLARRAALRAARKAAEEGVRIFAFALGPEAVSHAETYREMARVTGGRFFPVRDVGEVLRELPRLDVEAVQRVAITNETTGGGARATRIFEDGTFDGYLRLAPGENALRVTAVTRAGHRLESRRTVHFEPAPGSGDDVLEALRVRTIETDLARRARTRAPRRSLEVQVEGL